jgi:phosphoglycerate dehydrogenase-like enzyme
VLISPHVGGNSTAFLPRARAMVREQVTRYLQNDPLANVIVAGGAANPRGPAKE